MMCDRWTRSGLLTALAVTVAALLSGPARGEEKGLFDDEESSTPELADVSGGPKSTAKLKLTSKALAEEWKGNKDAFKKKYDKKPVEVTGIVVGVGRDLGVAGSALVLNGAEDPQQFRTIEINCQTDVKDPWKKAKLGQTVRLSGTMSIIGDPTMSKCKILTVAGEPWKVRTAEELSKGFAADAAKAEEKFRGRFVAVSGEIGKIEFNDVKAASVTLKTPAGSPAVIGRFSAFELPFTSKLKSGQKIVLYGKSPSLSDGMAELMMCITGE